MWTPDEIALVEEVAHRIWTTLEHRRAEAELRAREERLAFLLRLNDTLRPLDAIQPPCSRPPPGCWENISASPASGIRRWTAASTPFAASIHGGLPLAGQLPRTFGDALRDALRRGETVVVSDDFAAESRLTDTDRATYEAHQMAGGRWSRRRRLIKGGRVVAGLRRHPTPRVWTAGKRRSFVTWRTDLGGGRTHARRGRSASAEYRLRLALDASAGGSWTWNATTNEVHWDERFRTLYGFAPDEPAD